MPLTSGTRLGHYDVVAPLGAGGMGEVYRATDRRLGREVALKLLPAEVATDAGRLARFEREARTVAALNHPSIVTLFSVEDADGTRFLTMELVEGPTLDQHVTPGGLPVERVVELGIALADALAAAHEKGVVHRDLKPTNVMLTREGRVKVLDFGLAKLGAPDPGLEATQAETLAQPLSAAGQVVGTVPYMAPEQVRGEPVDSRTDLFALGVVLYELASGRRPFEGATPGVVASAILRDAPAALGAVRADAPGDLELVIARCLEKEPQARYQTAREVGDELRRVRLADEAGPAPKPTWETAALLKPPPTPATPLLGREETLESAAALLRGGARVLTVTGYGGTGKTRFSIELFHRLVSEYAGGAAFVSLASVTAAAEVLPTVAVALDIPEAHGRSPLEALSTVIGDRRVLLVLDNLEQVLEAAVDVAALVSRCPSLQVIATSRAPLKIGAESEFDLPPLDLPSPDATSLDVLTSCPSVALFVQRAEKVKPGFALTTANAGDQRLLRRASVFHEGWTLEAMEEVCYGQEERHRALDELDALVEKGLVRVVGSGERYALLETIRAFSAEQLHAGGEVEAVRNAHGDHLLAFASGIHAGVKGTGQVEAVRRARDDNANMHAAIQWLTVCARAGDLGALEKGLLLAGHLNWFWHMGGQHLTARGIVDELLALATDRPPSRGRALAQLTNGMISTVTGELERCLGESRRAYDDGRAVGDREVMAEGIMYVGYVQLHRGKMAEARAALDEAIELGAGGVSDFIHALGMTIKGMLLFAGGDLEGGMALVEQGRRIQDRLGDCEGGGVGLSFLAQMTFAKGDHAGALGLYRDALTSFDRVGDRPEIARVHSEMGWTALAAGDARPAQHSFVLAVYAYEEVGSPRGTGLALLGLAAVEAAEGRSERAVAIAAAAEALSERAGVVVEHPMDPGVVSRIEALKASIPKGALEGLVANASTLSPAAVLAMVAE